MLMSISKQKHFMDFYSIFIDYNNVFHMQLNWSDSAIIVVRVTMSAKWGQNVL